MDILVQVIIIVITSVTGLLVSIVGYFTVRLIRQNDETQKANLETQKANVQYQKDTTKDINEIKFNYLDRFEKVKDQIMESEERIINNIAGQFRHKVNSDDV